MKFIKKDKKKNVSVEEKIKYNFKNKDLLKRALSHSSTQKQSNERLEFLGDAVLELIISEHIFRHYSFDEGEMSQKRSLIVKRSSLAEAAANINLSEFMFFGKSEIAAGGTTRPSILADAIEALIGAIYLDGGYKNAKLFVFRVLGEKIDEAVTKDIVYDYKTTVAETLMKDGIKNIKYVVYKEEGPEHDKRFFVHLKVGGKCMGKGKAKTKKHAEQEAARDALNKINKGREKSNA